MPQQKLCYFSNTRSISSQTTQHAFTFLFEQLNDTLLRTVGVLKLYSDNNKVEYVENPSYSTKEALFKKFHAEWKKKLIAISSDNTASDFYFNSGFKVADLEGYTKYITIQQAANHLNTSLNTQGKSEEDVKVDAASLNTQGKSEEDVKVDAASLNTQGKSEEDVKVDAASLNIQRKSEEDVKVDAAKVLLMLNGELRNLQPAQPSKYTQPNNPHPNSQTIQTEGQKRPFSQLSQPSKGTRQESIGISPHNSSQDGQKRQRIAPQLSSTGSQGSFLMNQRPWNALNRVTLPASSVMLAAPSHPFFSRQPDIISFNCVQNPLANGLSYFPKNINENLVAVSTFKNFLDNNFILLKKAFVHNLAELRLLLTDICENKSWDEIDTRLASELSKYNNVISEEEYTSIRTDTKACLEYIGGKRGFLFNGVNYVQGCIPHIKKFLEEKITSLRKIHSKVTTEHREIITLT